MANRFWGSREGATMIEYALIIALITLVGAVSLGDLGQSTLGLYGKVQTIPF
jgi:Flp pilus assembly pilin Flp